MKAKCFQIAIAVIAISLHGSLISSGGTQSSTAGLEAADAAFKDAKFAEAEKLYARVAAQDSKNYSAAVRLGQIAVLGNRLIEAKKWLSTAIALNPDEKTPKALLGEAHYRMDEFERAASLFSAVGREAKAKKLASFKNTVPYQITGEAQVTRLKFVHTDPLPLVRVKVNESEEVNFLIDTGGGEVLIDTEFAKKVGAADFGVEQGIFGGDLKADTGQGRVDSITLGDFVVKNVPVSVLSTRRFAAAARGKQVDGIIGTVLLYHFISTLDYSNGELVLRRRTKENLKQIEQESVTTKPVVVPFWMAGDHLMLARGSVNRSNPVLLFVDTGAAGIGFTGPQSIIDQAGIKLAIGAETTGTGGGGAVKMVPFNLEELSLGQAKERDLIGVFGPFPASLELKNGFRIGGLISHQFFRPYSVTFDFDGMRIFLKRKQPS